jgi:hypothetical protein
VKSDGLHLVGFDLKGKAMPESIDALPVRAFMIAMRIE